jgi:hypothetical protein
MTAIRPSFDPHAALWKARHGDPQRTKLAVSSLAISLLLAATIIWLIVAYL